MYIMLNSSIGATSSPVDNHVDKYFRLANACSVDKCVTGWALWAWVHGMGTTDHLWVGT